MHKSTVYWSILLLYIFSFTTITINSLNAQVTPYSIIWQRPIGGSKQDEIRNLVNTPDGGCAFTGFSKSIDGDVTFNKGDDDLMVGKMDAFGRIEWIKTYGGNGQEWGRHIQLTEDGGYIIAGHATSLGDFLDVKGNNGGFDYWIVKVNSKGELEWQKTLGGSVLDLAYSAQQTPDGGYIVFGGVTSSDGNIIGKTSTDADYWLVKLDANANIMWQKVIGGSKHEEGSSVEITADGGFIISGFTTSNDKDATGNHGADDAYIVKTDALGNIQWSKCYGGSGEDAARGAVQTSDGGYIFAGYTNSEDGDVVGKHDDQDFWVVKLDAGGNIQWQKPLGGGSLEYAYYIEETRDHTGYLVAGHSGSNNGNISGNHGQYDCWALELDLQGKLVWQKPLGGSDNDYGRSITQTITGDYLVSGYTNSIDSNVAGEHGGTDGWIVKLKGDCFPQNFYQDADGDGFGNASMNVLTCDIPAGYILNNTDCDDTDASVFPNTAEVCNGYDDDCDSQVDEGVQTSYYRDADGDTYGDPGAIKLACAIGPAGYVSNNLDCNDDPAIGFNIHPLATETCNSFDDDCNGATDEAAKVYNYTENTSGVPFSFSIHATATNLTRVNGSLNIVSCETGFSTKSFATGNSFNNSLPAIEFTIIPSAGYELHASSFSANLRRASNGPAKVRYAYSINGGNSWIDQGLDQVINSSPCGFTTPTSWDFIDFTTTQPVIFRIYGYSASSASGVLQLLNVNFNGTVCLMFDADHDGYIASLDCNDGNASIHPNAIEKCNLLDDDCDNSIDEGAKTTFYADSDNDTYGNPGVTVLSCSAPAGFVINGEDCNDASALIHPGVTEICNGIDEDCNSQIDDGVQTTYYADNDHDNFGNPNAITFACSLPSGYVTNNNDCNDAAAAVRPNATETCNGLDDNCDGITDETVKIYSYTSNVSGIPETIGLVATGSNLKPVNGVAIAVGSSACPTGFSTKNFSTESSFSTSLSAVEFTISPIAGYQVNGASFSVELRTSGSGPSLARLAYSINGGNNWITDGIDHTLSSAACGITTGFNWDFPDFSTGQSVMVRIYAFKATAISGILQVMNTNFNGNICQILDADNDTYNTIVDCNDANPAVHPNAVEVCNTIDDDCDTQTDEGVKTIFYADADNDNYGNAAVATLACSPPAGYTSSNTDCNDGNNAIYPGAPEKCNAIDDDCDNLFDEGALATFYADADHDSYGNKKVSVVTCPAPVGYVADATDCNDAAFSIHPNATEVCNLIDDDCDAAIDDGVQLTFYADNDNDTFGNPDQYILACTVPSGYVSNNADCNDAAAAIQPNALEICNGIDDNCNGAQDESVQIYHYVDNTSGIPFSIVANAAGTNLTVVNGATSSSVCPTGFSTKNYPVVTEFDSLLAAVQFSVLANNGYEIGASAISANLRSSSSGPSLVRFAYSIDNGATWTDEGVNHTVIRDACGVTNLNIWDFDDFTTAQTLIFRVYGFNAFATSGILQLLDVNFNGTICPLADDDGDGYNSSIDCDDNSASIHPGALELCNGVDDNCNVEIDEGAKILFYADEDNDSYGNVAISILACNASTGFVADNSDCNDGNAAIHPNATEICNGVDENCNSQIDDGAKTTFYADADADTYGNPNVTTLACTLPAGYVSNNADCNDANAAIKPTATEVCNGVDDNCNATTDEEILIYSYLNNLSGIPSVISASTTASNLTTVNGAATTAGCSTGFSVVNFTSTGSYSTSLPAIEFTITPASGFQLQPTYFSVDLRKSGGGPGFVRFAYSINGGSTWIDQGIDQTVLSNPCGTSTGFTWDFNNFTISQPLKFRIYGFQSNNLSGILQLLNLNLSGKVCPLILDADNDGFNNTVDCNDNNPAINPSATEVCNTVDDNCNSQIDEGVSFTFYADADHDNFGNAAVSIVACTPPVGYVSGNTDCNDNNSAVNPAATEICNTIDDDCDALTDEPTALYNYIDNISGIPATIAANTTGTNFTLVNGAMIASGCDKGFSAKNFAVATTFSTSLPAIEFTLKSNPGYRVEASSFSADLRRNGGGPTKIRFAYSINGGNTWTDQGTNQSLLNAVCGTMTPSAWDFPDFSTMQTIIIRMYGFDATTTGQLQLLNVKFNGNVCPAITDEDNDGFTSAVDCNDANPAIHPNAPELCNNVDDDCDAQIDEGVKTTFYADNDNDTYGNPAVTSLACSQPSGYVSGNTDCNDNNQLIHPNAIEICNAVDDDCDAQTDEGVLSFFYFDGDNDTYGNPAISVSACVAPAGYSAFNTDCNDANAAIHPNAIETCNNTDDNCNGTTDEPSKIYNYTNNTSGTPSSFDLHSTANNLTRVNGADVSTLCTTGYSSKNFPTPNSFNTSLPAIEFTITPAAGYKLNATSFSADVRRSGSGPASLRFAYSTDGGNSWIDQGTNQTVSNANCGITTTSNWDFADFSTKLSLKFRIYGFNASGTTCVLQLLNINLTGKVCAVNDADGDGYETALDCNDNNPLIHPNATEVCNSLDDDCDTEIDEGVKSTFYADADNDTYGNPNISQLACAATVGFVINNTDCNDGNAAINPGATETCNNLDDNCNGTTDEAIQAYHYTSSTTGVPSSIAGHSTATNLILANGSAIATGSGTCVTGLSTKNYSNATLFNVSLSAVQFTIFPDAGYQLDVSLFSAELRRNVNGPASVRLAYSRDGGTTWIDQGINQSLLNKECGTMTNATWDIPDFSTAQPLILRIYGFNASSTSGILQLLNVNLVAKVCVVADADNDGYNATVDCNDANPAIHPGATEICNLSDDDCDAQVDENVQITFYADNDNDLYGNPQATALSCVAPSGYVSNNTDCNDANAAIHPNTSETCNNIDDNCNGTTDEAVQVYHYTDNTTGIPQSVAQFATATNLIRVNGATTATGGSACLTGLSSKNFPVTTIYSSTLPAIEFTITPTTGHQVEATGFSAELRRGSGGPALVRFAYSKDGGINWINEGADRTIPNSLCGTMTAATWDVPDFSTKQSLKFRVYGFNATATSGVLQLLNLNLNGRICPVTDADGDGFDAAIDCNDANPAIYPNATEVCNNVDDDCDAQVDENVKSTFYADADNDLYGNLSVTILACIAPAGFVANNTDCNDGNSTIHPFATEVCNTIDDDCDTQVDENVKSIFYADADNDTYGNLSVTKFACTAPVGFVANSTDCNDANSAIHPNATETCNTIDDNCNGITDEPVEIYHYSDNPSGSPVTISVNTTATNLLRVNTAEVSTTCPTGFSSKNFPAPNAFSTTLPATEFTITPAGGFKIEASSFTAELRRSGSGPASVRFAYSRDNGATWIDQGSNQSLNSTSCGLMTAASWDFTDFSTTLPLKFRIYGFNASATTGIFQLLNINLNGKVCVITDADGDGFDFSVDCNDANPLVYPNATEICNTIDDDCDTQIDENVKSTFYADSDNDLYGNPAATTLACTVPAGYVSNNTDCNDSNQGVHPNATETCNMIDDDCDTKIDENVKSTFYADTDNDTYGNLSVTKLACSAPAGYVSNSTDCNDGNSSVNPNATEVCNTIDDDCDTQVDENVKSTFYADADNDTYGNLGVTILACTAPSGFVANSTDCNDANSSIHPNAAETCNNIDDNCNGATDEVTKIYSYADNVSGIPLAVSVNATAGNLVRVNSAAVTGACPTGFSSKNFPTTLPFSNSLPAIEFTITPAAGFKIEASSFNAELRRSGSGPASVRFAYSKDNGATWIDQGSNQSLNSTSCGLMTAATWDFTDFSTALPLKFRIYGFNASSTTGIFQLLNINLNGRVCVVTDADGDGYDFAVDCDDANPLVYPTATEICNAIDDDCDTQIDENVKLTFYADGDNDTYGNPIVTTLACVAPFGYVSNNTDCNDAKTNVHPNATEICNNIDDDCDTQVDENVKSTFYSDSDNDTYGNPVIPALACQAPVGYVSNNTDCNDSNTNIHPNATEICNTIDDDCDTQVDENVKTTFYADADNDTYGNPAVTILACSAPSGYVSNSTDCNDNNASVHPNATEICNAIDDNCNSTTDEPTQVYHYTDNVNGIPSSWSVNTTVSNLTRVNGAVTATGTSACLTGFSSKSFANATIYDVILPAIEFTLTPSSGYQMEAASFSADLRRGNGGPSSIRFAYSLDNGNSWIDEGSNHTLTNTSCGIITSFTWDFADFSTTHAIRIRIYGFNASNTSGVLQLLNVNFNAKICPAADADNDSYDASVDCNDNNPAIHPNATEICNTLDDDCDTQIDENVKSTFYADADNDTYGNLNVSTLACSAPLGYVIDNTDCNDNNASIHPIGLEICNSVDDDCDAAIDEDFQQFIFYADNDNDSFGDSMTSVLACSAPAGYVTDNSDCDDANSAANSAAAETCNGTDDNCNGLVDESIQVYNFTDNISGIPYSFSTNVNGSNLSRVNGSFEAVGCNPGFSSKDFANTTLFSTSLPAVEFTVSPLSGYLIEATNLSIELRRNGIGPSNVRFAYSINGGDTWTDQGSDHILANTDCGVTDTYTWDFADFPSSQPIIFRIYGFNASTNLGVLQVLNVVLSGKVCTSIDVDGDGYDTNLDCNDNNNAINPGASDVCNGIDDNCNGLIDESTEIYHYTDNTSGIPLSISPHATATQLILVNGAIAAPGCPSGFPSKNFPPATSFNVSLPAVEFSITPDGGFQLEATSFSADVRRNGLGPASLRFAYSLDNGNSWVDQGSDQTSDNTECGITANKNWDFGDYTTMQPVTFRIYGFNASTTGVLQLLNVNLNGNVCPLPDADNDGYNVISDCNDNDVNIYPNAAEVCNGIDDDCDLLIDENSIIATITPLGSLDICSIDSVILEANGGAGLYYQWMENSEPIEGATNQFYTASSPGDFSVLVTDLAGCNNTSAIATVFYSCRVSDEIQLKTISRLLLFPNPNDGEFVIDLSLGGNADNFNSINTMGTVRITNILGQVIYAETIPIIKGKLKKEIRLDPGVADGIYLLNVMVSDEASSAIGVQLSERINIQK
ncbi:MAG: MopE-related protein [Chitinophagales bacterium]